MVIEYVLFFYVGDWPRGLFFHAMDERLKDVSRTKVERNEEKGELGESNHMKLIQKNRQLNASSFVLYKCNHSSSS
jgi:hypothetical protein